MKKWITWIILAVFFLSITISRVSAEAPSADAAAKPTPNPEKIIRQTQHAEDKADRVKSPKLHYQGIVLEVTPSSLTLTLEDGTNLLAGITESTKIQIPSLGKDAAVGDILPGVKASIQIQAGESGEWIALRIHVIPGKPAKIHRVGIVTEYIAGTSITIQSRDDQLYTFLVTPDTKILPEERMGELAASRLVTIICPRDVTGGPHTAIGIVVHPDQTGE